jgi:hypothetical protein
MSLHDKAERLKTLTELAIATREKVERQTFDVYLDDTAQVPTWALVDACYRLRKSAEWFPKVKELLDACSTVLREREIRNQAKRLPPADECDPLRAKEWLEKIKIASQGHRMPDPNSPISRKADAAGKD